jgi:hypothetical protein
MRERPDFLKGEKSRPLPTSVECPQHAQFCTDCLFVVDCSETFVKIYEERFERRQELFRFSIQKVIYWCLYCDFA